MKVSARVRGEWLQIPYNGKNTIKWLGQEAWKRYEKLLQAQRNVEDGLPEKVSVQEVRKTRGGAILDPDDTIIEVLDDNDFVNVGKYTEIKPRRFVYSHVNCNGDPEEYAQE